MHHLYRSTRPTSTGASMIISQPSDSGMRTLFMSHTDFGGVSNSMIPPGMKRILPGLQSDKDSPRMFVNVETLNKSVTSPSDLTCTNTPLEHTLPLFYWSFPLSSFWASSSWNKPLILGAVPKNPLSAAVWGFGFFETFWGSDWMAIGYVDGPC